MRQPRVPSRFISSVRRRLSGLEDDSGFTLVEIAVASGVILTSLMLMAGVLVSGLTGTAIARERQSANGLANQTLEKVRALPFETLRRGLDSTDLANTAGSSDPNISTTGCGGSYCFKGEQVVSGTNPDTDPLVPHRRTTSAGDSTDKTFTVSAYVTYYENNLAANSYRVTTHVSWTSAVRGGSSQSVEAQTLIFPNGCASLPAHPYSGPCQSSFTASAAADPATVSLSGQIAGIELANAILSGGAASSDATVEQTSRVEGLVRGHKTTIQAVAGEEQTIGGSVVSSQADNDPDATKGPYETRSLPTPAANASLTGSAGTLAAGITAGNGGQTTSTTAASTAESRNCPNITGITDETDSAPCGGSRTATGTATTLSSTLNVGPLTAAALPLAEIAAQTSPNTSIVDRHTAPGIDRSSATVSRSAVDIGVGGLPAVVGIKPIGFDYFVKLNGYTDSATAQAGIGSTAPAGMTGGTLSFYTGAVLNPYTTVNLSTMTSSNLPTIPTLTISAPLLQTVITMSATITAPSTETTSSCSGTCTRTSGGVRVTPVKVSVSLQIVVAGTTAVDTTLALDPGTINAKASYVAAPTS